MSITLAPGTLTIQLVRSDTLDSPFPVFVAPVVPVTPVSPVATLSTD